MDDSQTVDDASSQHSKNEEFICHESVISTSRPKTRSAAQRDKESFDDNMAPSECNTVTKIPVSAPTLETQKVSTSFSNLDRDGSLPKFGNHDPKSQPNICENSESAKSTVAVLNQEILHDDHIVVA